MPQRRAAAGLLVLLTACSADDGEPAVSATASSGGPRCSDLPACCPVASMIDAYPGDYPNEPYGPQPAADACVATRHDVIVVLGCPNEADGTPSTCQVARADLAVTLMRAGYGDWFITSGGAVANDYVEADTLRDLLVARGVAADRILTDARAEHTDENVYFATRIMDEQGWASAVVVSDDPGHLVLTAVCDANCCVDLGRLTVLSWPTPRGAVVAGHYARYPWAEAVSEAECAQIEKGTKLMCVNLPTRRACAGDFQL